MSKIGQVFEVNVLEVNVLSELAGARFRDRPRHSGADAAAVMPVEP